MRHWMPTGRELVVELLALLAIPTYQLIQSIVAGESPTHVLLTTLGAIGLMLAILFFWEQIRQPFRRRVLTGKELMDTIDVWLRENGFGRQPYQMVGYSHALLATYGDSTVYIGVEAQRNVLAVAATRAATQDDTATIGQMNPWDWMDFRFELEAELSRFGVYYSTTDDPFAVTVWMPLHVDEDLSDAKLIEVIDIVRRADRLVSLLAGRRVTASLLTKSIGPDIPDAWQGRDAPPPPGPPTVSISSLTLGQSGENGSVELRASELRHPGLGAWVVDIGYDLTIVTLVECVPEWGGVCNRDFAPDKIRVVGASATGLQGNMLLCTLTFAWAHAGASPLDLDVEVFADATIGNPQEMSPRIKGGRILCIPPTGQSAGP